MKPPRVSSPPVCRRAWARYLKAEGCTVEEIGLALELDPRFVRALLRPRLGKTSRRSGS